MSIPADIAATIVDPKAYAKEQPVQDAFTFLRREMPLAVAHPPNYDPFWVVTKHADILEVEKLGDLFHNEDRSTTLTTIDADKYVREIMGGSPNLVRSLVQMDNPDHFKYRILTQGWFLPQNLRKLEARIRQIARTFVDHLASFGGRCDFARDVAFLYPLHVIMEVLGVPEADEPRMLRLTQELFGAADPDLNRSGTQRLDTRFAAQSRDTQPDSPTGGLCFLSSRQRTTVEVLAKMPSQFPSQDVDTSNVIRPNKPIRLSWTIASGSGAKAA